MLLIYVPYQDVIDYSITRIKTREIYILEYLQQNVHFDKIIVINKPRTYLDYILRIRQFGPKAVLLRCKQSLIPFDIVSINNLYYDVWNQIKKGRNWLPVKYAKYTEISQEPSVIFSDNPFAYRLYEKRSVDSFLVFDCMDNFCIHPSLSNEEKKEAYDAYRVIFKNADFITANSKQTCEYFEKKFGRRPQLIKNGIERDRYDNIIYSQKVDKLMGKLDKPIVGYVGKLGVRIDDKLIYNVAIKLPNINFVFFGPFLRGQDNNLKRLFKSFNNIHYCGILSYDEVPYAISKFDICMIPHSVGVNENGGDALKLYEYMAARKPIITTGILGVDEYKEQIYIGNTPDFWEKAIIRILENPTKCSTNLPVDAYWDNRLRIFKDKISDWWEK